jgi:hypothetical protein
VSLLKDKITLVGTLKKNKKEIPVEFLPNKNKEVNSKDVWLSKASYLGLFHT